MKKFALNAEPRKELGKKSTKALRKQDLIPCVLNGGKIVELPYKEALRPGEKLVEIANNRGLITTDMVVKSEDVRKLIYTPDIFEIDLTLNGEERKAVLKDIQFQPVKDTILHLDFLEVFPGKPIEMDESLFFRQLRNLEVASRDESNDIKGLIKEIVPTYNPKEE